MEKKEKKSKRNGAVVINSPSHNNIDIFGNDKDNIFANSVDYGHRIDPRANRIIIITVIFIVIYVLCLLVPKGLVYGYLIQAGGRDTGSPDFTFSWIVMQVQNNFKGVLAVFTGEYIGPVNYAGLGLMLRQVVIGLAGAGLALCGAVYQGSFRNALVSPSTLGVMTGAQLGVTLYILIFLQEVNNGYTYTPWLEEHWYNYEGADRIIGTLWNTYGLALCSMICCFLVVGLIALVIKMSKRTKVSGIMLIITGTVISGVIGAFISTAQYYYVATDPEGVKAQLLREMQVATFYRNFGWIDILAIGIPLVIVFIIIMKLRMKMMILSFEDTESRTMGIESRKMRFTLIAVCTALVAIIVSFCGAVGFVGFLVPHLARRIVGPNFKYLLPASMVLGAVFVLGAYMLLMMTMGATYQTMLGVFISIGGSFVFMLTVLRGGGQIDGRFK